MAIDPLPFLRLGLSVIPIDPDPTRSDGKAPPEKFSWRGFMAKPMDEKLASKLQFDKIALCCGVASGNLECIDFDRPGYFEKWCLLVQRNDLLVERTPKGVHVYYRISDGVASGNTKLAREGMLTAIETRGQGGYVICAPSEGYEFDDPLSTWADIPSICMEERAELFAAARSLTDEQNDDKPVYVAHSDEKRDRPGDALNSQMDWSEILDGEKLFTHNGLTYWRRPGKSIGQSATTGVRQNGQDLFKCFSSNWPGFEPDECVTKFTAYARIKHGGDFKAATKAAAAKYGFKPMTKSVATKDAPVDLETGEVFEFHNTEAGMAKRFVSMHKDVLRYVPQWNQWLVWNGRRWVPDETSGGDISMMVLAMLDRMETERLAESDFIRKQETDKKIKAIVSLAKIRPEVKIDPADIDADDWILGCPNGAVDLRTGELLQPDPSRILTRQISCEYDPDAKVPERFIAFLSEVMQGRGDLIEYLVRALAYCLTGSVDEQIFFIAHGSGQNGKGVLMRTMTRLMGTYSVSLNPDSLMHKLIPTVPADIASLHGARWVPVFETDSRRGFSEVILKQLTGGDPITARRLHQNFFTFHPKFKLFISSNELPEMRNFDFAIRRRLHLIPFDWQAIDRDDHLDQKLTAEMPGILRLLVEALGEYLEGGMRPPEGVLEAVRNYQAENDSLEQFITERCDTGVDLTVTAGTIQAAYKSWALINNAPDLSGYHFSRKMERKGFQKKTPAGIKTYYGITLLGQQEDRYGN